jgi:signal transduction histidine kinase
MMPHSDAIDTRRITATYVGVLVTLAVLAAGSYYLPQEELKIQQSSAAVLNRIDRQNTLLDHTALLAENLVIARTEEQRGKFRAELLGEVQRMEAAHTLLAGGDPRVEVPAELDRQVREYIAATRALAKLPAGELDWDHPLFQFIFSEATGGLAGSLDSVAQQYQRRDEAGIRRLRRLQAGVFAGTLAALTLMGWFVFRPMAQRVRREQEERLRSERLAVIGTMAAKFAHEIRNPLGSIRLNLDSVRAGHAAPELLASIDSAVRRIERISDGYLQFARLPKTTREPLRLDEWLPDALRFHEPLLRQHRIALRTEFDAGAPPVVADKAQLEQALLNLVRNAVEAMPDGGTLTVRTARNGATAQISVADTGLGMDEEQRARLFQPFWTTKPGGTGLGLVLTQQIVAEHGGRIDCASRPGQGTTFTLHLPLAHRSNHAR